MDNVRSVQELIEKTRGMPLEKMRFFIGEDRKEPKCFGIYQDSSSGYWIVYKNKADGSRSVRYHGPDEAYAAQELWAKINSEIDLRRPKQAMQTEEQRRRQRREKIITGVIVAAFLAAIAFFFIRHLHDPRRGYYASGHDLYYYQDDSWYWYSGGDWVYWDDPMDETWVEDASYYDSYPYDDGGEPFEDTDYYHEEEHKSDSFDFSDWDSSDTDWSSDW